MQIIDILKKNSPQRELASKYGVGKGTIKKIFDSRNKIIDKRSNDEKIGCRIPKFSEIYKQTFELFMRLRMRNNPVGGPMIQTVALKFFCLLGIKIFKHLPVSVMSLKFGII